MKVDLHFLHSGRIPQCSARVNKFFEGYYTLQYMSSGGVELFYDDQRYVLEGEWFWPASPGPHIRFHTAAGYPSWEHRYVAFKGPLICRWQAAGLILPAPLHVSVPQDFPQRFDTLLMQIQRQTPWSCQQAVNLLENLLLELAEARVQSTRFEPWLSEAMEYLDKNCIAPNYETLSQSMGMALSTMRRRFRLATGTAIHTYVLQCRIAQARTMLCETEKPVKRISEELGYTDVYFFSRQFKQLTGVAPATYRKSRQ